MSEMVYDLRVSAYTLESYRKEC